jgi:hypothetical protein
VVAKMLKFVTLHVADYNLKLCWDNIYLCRVWILTLCKFNFCYIG